MFLAYEQEASSAIVKDSDDLTIPANATAVELQASTQNINYTMDGATDPTSTSGMVLLTTAPPKEFLIEDLKRIRFTQGAGGAGNLNLHYFAGRNV